MNYATIDVNATCTPETDTLHLILQRVIVDAVARNASNAGALAIEAAQAFKAGLAAFTAPPEQITGSGSNAAIPATVNYGGAKDAIPQQGTTGSRLPPELDALLEAAARHLTESRNRKFRIYI